MKWNVKKAKEMKYYEQPIGGTIPEAGSAEKYRTGSWRTFRPVRDEEACNNCLFCFIYCPDSSVIVKKGEVVGVDLEHCKGCGICARECPKECIEMVEESD